MWNDPKALELNVLGGSDEKPPYEENSKVVASDIQPTFASKYSEPPPEQPAGSGTNNLNGFEGPIEPPPDFSEYHATYITDDEGNTLSHDPHLNEDGEALHRYLLSQASISPRVLIKCSASHQESHTREVTRYNSETKTHERIMETSTETILDFSFTIDLTDYLLPRSAEPLIWLAGDREATYRGGIVRQVEAPPLPVAEAGKDVEAAVGSRTCRMKATKAEVEASEIRRKRRELYSGLPPWVRFVKDEKGTEASVESADYRQTLAYSANTTIRDIDDGHLSLPSKTLRGWADEYCASPKKLKEFTFRKELFGWNLAKIRVAVQEAATIAYTRRDPVTTELIFESNTISIKPDNRLSRMLSTTWSYILLWVLLVFPLVIWPYKRFSSRGGGEWRVAGSAFGFTKWVHMSDSEPGDTPETYEKKYAKLHAERDEDSKKPLFKATPLGISKLEGMREGEWFAAWQTTIMAFAYQQKVLSKRLTAPTDGPRERYLFGIDLDGYPDEVPVAES